MRVIHLLLIVLLSPLVNAAQPAYPMQAKAVAPGVYAVITPSRNFPDPVNKGWNSNSAFVVTGEGVLLVDTGSSTLIGESLGQTIASVTDQPVRWIVNTHAHGDHWLGNAAFAGSVEKIIASSRVDSLIRSNGQNWVSQFQRMTEGATGDSQVLPPNTIVDVRQELELGGVPVVIFPSGNSHSPGDLIVWLPAQRVLISGDVVYSDRMPSTNNADVRRWIAQLEELRALKPVVVVPGHGEVTDAQGLARLQGLLTAFWQAVAKGYEAGKADFEMVDDVRLALQPYSADYPGMDDKIPRDLPHVFLQVEAAGF